jgi:hypothetical protein
MAAKPGVFAALLRNAAKAASSSRRIVALATMFAGSADVLLGCAAVAAAADRDTGALGATMSFAEAEQLTHAKPTKAADTAAKGRPPTRAETESL